MSNFLTHKYGPLPAWGWGAVVGGGLLVMKLRASSAAKAPDDPAADPNNPGAGAGGSSGSGSSTAFLTGGSGNVDNTFGGGSLGMYSYPVASGGSLFVNLHRHPHGDSWHHGGIGYPFHAFDRHPFFNWGGLFGLGGSKDHGHHGFDPGHPGPGSPRPGGWNSDPYQYPRGGSGGGRSSRWADNNASSPGNHVN